MPKRVHTINQFHGGLNSFSDPRDAVENQLTEANDLMVDELGKVRTFGKSVAATNGIFSTASADTVPGYGLFHFSHDYPGLGSPYISGKGLADLSAVPAKYTILASAQTSSPSQKFFIFAHSIDIDNPELMPNEVDREFTGSQGSSNWNQNTAIAMTDAGVLSVLGDAVGQYSSLGVAYCPTTVGLTYRLYYDLDNLTTGASFTFKSTAATSGGGIQTIGDVSADVQSGYFEFIAGSTGGLRIEVKTLGVGAVASGQFDNFSLKEGGWSAFDTLGSETNFRMLPYNVDGQLRVTESNFDNTSTPKWYGYLIRNYFLTYEKYNGWYTENATYTLPVISSTAGGATSEAGKFSFQNSSTSGNPSTAAIHIEFEENSTGSWKFGLGSAEKYKFYISYIYDGGYDSGLVLLAESDADLDDLTDDNKGINLKVRIDSTASGSNSDWFTYHSPRIIGFRIYYVKLVTTQEQVSAPYCLQEAYFDKRKGSRLPLTNAWEEWSIITGGDVQTQIYIPDPPEILTYEDINGFTDKDVTSAQFKSICIVNRKAYIGNIKQDGKVNGDMMIKSPVNGFDLFPESKSIEVSVRDGDDIIKLEEYADRILQFKRQKMHLINISQEIEFLEDTYMHKGIDYPTASCKTDFGIAWVNKHGCYLYNGKNVDNLLEKQGRKMISDSDWQTHTANHVAIAYLPKHRQLIVVNSLSTAGNKDVYLYDMVTASWVTSTQAMCSSNSEALSNIVIDFNGDLMWSYKTTGSDFLKWDNSSSDKSSFVLKSKSMSFGSPTQRKNIYNVQIAYQGDGSAIVPTYGLNGDTTPTNTFTVSSLANVGTTSWTHLKLIPSSTVNNAQSFRFKLSGTAADDFAINDITVVYRLKSVK